MMQKKWFFFAPLALFLALAIVLGTGLGKDPTHLESELIGKPIPTFSKPMLLDMQQLVTEKSIQGPALLNVFASWCSSCYFEHPHLMKLSESKAVKIYGLNYKDKLASGLKFIAERGDPYELIIFDENGRLGIDLGVYGAPETFVINADNQIVYRHVGIVDEDVFQLTLKPKMLSSGKNSEAAQ